MVSLTLLISAVVASLVSASNIPIGGSSLPRTLELFVYRGSTKIGCVNGYGNFTANLQWCLPFNTGAGVNGSGYASLRGYEACSATGVLDCYESEAAVETQFYVSSLRLSQSCYADPLCRSSMETLPLGTVAHFR